MSSILRLVILILLVACQAEGEKSNTLVANHQQTDGEFTLSLPLSGNYLEGQSLDFSLRFPYPVQVTGSPRLRLTIGNSIEYAEYLPDSEPDELVFRYVVKSGDNDADGISVAGNLDLNGASLSFTGTNGTQNPPTGFSVPATAGIIVDTTSPTLSFATPAGGLYLRDMPITFSATASEPVIVSGTPRASLTIGGITRYANYISGSGTSTLLFRYTVANPDFDADGISKVSPVQLNGGSIRDRAGNLVSLGFTPPDTSSVLVNGLAPYVKSVILPSNGTYTFNQSIDVKLRFNEAVAVSGFPTISINVGGVSKNMAYIGGSTTTDLTFRYVVQAGDADADGVTFGNVISLNGGTVLSSSSVSALLGFVAPLTPGVRVSAPAPRIVNMSWTDGTYVGGQELRISAIFDKPVNVTGAPQISVNIGGTPRLLTYELGSGSSNISFSYTIMNGEADEDGVQILSPMVLNGGSIKDAEGIDAATAFTPPPTPNLLVQSNVPVITNVIPPTDGNYTVGEVLEFQVVYSSAVTVVGTEFVNLLLDVGGVQRQAVYFSGSGSTTLRFRYIVQPVDSDNDGISVESPISVSSSGRIRDSLNNNAGYSFLPPNMPNVQVNAGLVAPTILSVTSPVAGTYRMSDSLNFQVQFSEVVFASGAPRIPLTIGAETKYATYVSGSGSDLLVFRYVVGTGDFDNNGIGGSTTLDLNGGSIVDSDLMASSAVLPAQALSGVNVDGVVPSITGLTRPADGNYGSGAPLDFVATFTEPVLVSGTPRLTIGIGSSSRFATYVSGSGTSFLLFRYTVQAFDDDADGITQVSPLSLNGGTIRDGSGNGANLSFIPNNDPGINVLGSIPTITSVTGPDSGAYGAGASLAFTVTTSAPATVTGIPRLALNVGGTSRFATYVSGTGSTSLTFSYVVQPSENDSDGITLSSPIETSGGDIQTSGGSPFSMNFTPPNTASVLVDTVGPEVVALTAPAENNYLTTNIIDFTVSFTEPVTVTGAPRLALDFNGATAFASYHAGSGTNSIVFRRTIAMGDFDGDGIGVASPLQLNGGSLRDLAGNPASLGFTAPNTSNITINLVIPTITSVVAPASKFYTSGEQIAFTFNLSDTATVTGTPQVAITIGSTPVVASYVSGSGSSVLMFRYTVQAGQNDNDGVSIGSSVNLNGGTIANSVGTNFALGFTAPDTTGVKVDTSVPTITSITPPSNQIYGLSSQLNFFVNFTEAVTVTGTPQLGLDIGGTARSATFVSGSGTNSLLFRYTTIAGDTDTNGISLASPVALNSGTIRDAALNPAVLAFTSPSTSSVLVDTTSPSISSVTASANGTYNSSQSVFLTATFSEIVTVSGAPRISLTVGATPRYADYVSGGGTNTLLFRYTPVAGDSDTNGIQVFSPVDLNSGSIRDGAQNNSTLTFTPPVTSGVLVDTTGPTITSVVAPPNATYTVGQNLNFTVNFSEPVTVVGAPRLQVTVGFTTRFATYVSGSGSSALIYRYTVPSGDLDADGIQVSSPLDLNGGTLRDSSSNNASLTFTAPVTTGVRVDAVIPEITSISTSGAGIYKTGANIDFTVLFSKPVTTTGAPRIALTVGSTTAYATYLSGSGSASHVYRYTPAATHLDLNGISFLGTELELNGGTIRDAGNANAVLTYPALPDLSGIVVLYTAITNWYDFNNPASLTLASDGANLVISQVTDRVGTVNLTATTTQRPIYNATGFGTNSTGHAQFNGTTNQLNWTTPAFRSFIIVFRTQSTNTAHTIFRLTSGSNNGQSRFTVNNNATVTLGRNATGDFKVNGGNFSGTNATSKAWTWAPSTRYIAQARWTTAANSAANTLGAAGFNGQIAEVILLNTSLTETQANEIRTQLNAKHGVY